MSDRMSKRYTYTPLTPEQFSAGLNEAGLTMRQFCRITGSDERRVQRWLSGEQEGMPMWVGSLLAALTVPEAMRKVKAYADLVVQDTRREGGPM